MAQLLPRRPLVFRWEKSRSLSHMVHTFPRVMRSSRTPGGEQELAVALPQVHVVLLPLGPGDELLALGEL